MNIYVATDLKRQKKTDYHIEEFENYIVQVIHVNCISQHIQVVLKLFLLFLISILKCKKKLFEELFVLLMKSSNRTS